MRALLVFLLCAGCANPDIPPASESQRNVMSAGLGVASLMTDCGDGLQRDTRGAGVGFILTGCIKPAAVAMPLDVASHPIERGIGIVSVGVGLAFTVSNCGGAQLIGFGVGLGVVAAPCPSQPRKG